VNHSVIMQQINVSNTMHGTKPLVMRLKISYKLGGAPVEEAATVSTFPAGF
jgi:AP-1 complex subunit gamma-1